MAEADDFVPPLPMEEDVASAPADAGTGTQCVTAPLNGAANGAEGARPPEENGESAEQPAEGNTPDDGEDAGRDSAEGEGADGQASTSQPAAGPTREEEELLLKEFFREMKSVDRDNEVNRILGAFKLNPFEQLGLPLTATVEEVRRQYRKVSLMVHPDKCSHPRAQDAFEIVGHAQKELLEEDKLNELVYVINMARAELRKERKKKTKNDSVIRLAAAVHKDGREGVEAEYEQTPEFHEAWRVKARDMIAQAEWRRRKLTKRMKEEELRIEEGEEETRKRLKATREHHKAWEDKRETRVGTWRDFAKGNKNKKGKNLNLGGLKPPKLKMEDEDKTYIQRPVGEQFRPPPPVAARPRTEGKSDKKIGK